jgi:hypothetical protein
VGGLTALRPTRLLHRRPRIGGASPARRPSPGSPIPEPRVARRAGEGSRSEIGHRRWCRTTRVRNPPEGLPSGAVQGPVGLGIPVIGPDGRMVAFRITPLLRGIGSALRGSPSPQLGAAEDGMTMGTDTDPAAQAGTELDAHHVPETNGRMAVCRRCGCRTDGPGGLHHVPSERQAARSGDWLMAQSRIMHIARARQMRGA